MLVILAPFIFALSLQFFDIHEHVIPSVERAVMFLWLQVIMHSVMDTIDLSCSSKQSCEEKYRLETVYKSPWVWGIPKAIATNNTQHFKFNILSNASFEVAFDWPVVPQQNRIFFRSMFAVFVLVGIVSVCSSQKRFIPLTMRTDVYIVLFCIFKLSNEIIQIR